MTKEAKILIAILVVVVGGGLFAAMSGSPSSVDNTELLSKQTSHKLGEGNVQVVEFGDYQCPACGQSNPTVKRLVDEYDGKITFVYRHFPLPIHKNAVAAAKAAESAGAQDKFWEMHNKLFESQDEWSEVLDPTGIFTRYATNLGLDGEQFKKDLESDKFEELISSDQDDGYELGVQGTPTFFINGKQQRSFDYNSLKNAIDAELK